MAKTVRTTDASGELVLRRDSYAYTFDGGSNVQYLVFARVKYATYNGNQTITLLVTGIDNYAYSNIGVYILQGSVRANGATTGNAKAIIPGRNPSNVGFGYYKGDDGYVYFGVKRVATYTQRTNITILHETGAPNPFEYEQFYAGPTEPTGWTVVKCRNSLEETATGIASLDALKTQMKSWIDEMPTSETRICYVALSGTISPFPTGSHIVIQISKSDLNNYGTAFITCYRSSAGCHAYLMSYFNGAWTNPTTITSS